MADIKISDLTAAGTLTGTEEVPIVQSSTTVKATAQDIADLSTSGTNIGTNNLTITDATRKLIMQGSTSGETFSIRDTGDTANLWSIDGGGVVTFNEAYSLPIADGTEYQILRTDGAGAVTWEAQLDTIQFAATDFTTDFTVRTFDIVVPVPYPFYVTEVRANVKTAPTGSNAIFDVKMNGTSILSTLVSIDDGEKTSKTATTPAVISTNTLVDDNELTIECTQIGSTVAGKGLTITLNGYRVAAPPAPSYTNTYSLLFDGVDDYVTMGNPTELQITGALSISFWFKSTSAATGDNDMTIAKDDFSNRCYAIWTQAFGTTKVIEFAIFSSGASSVVQTASDYQDGNWHHVMCVFVPSTSMNIYVDGVNDGSNTTSIPATIDNDPADFKLGGNSSYSFLGNLDEVAIWNSDQTSNLSTIYNSGTPTDLASLSPVGWWRNGDGDTYPTITDHGSGGNDGTMTNMTSGDIVTDVP